jgi:hypothetical protein
MPKSSGFTPASSIGLSFIAPSSSSPLVHSSFFGLAARKKGTGFTKGQEPGFHRALA